MFPRKRIRLLPVMVGWSLGGAQKVHLEALRSAAGENESLLDMINEVNAEARRCWDAELFVMKNNEIQLVTI
jgi:hypothetical protein